MPTYGKIKVNTLTYDASGTATDLPISTIATDTDLGLKANLSAPTFTGTINGASLILSGDLTVNGTTTFIDTTTLQVEDKNIEIGKVSTPSNTTADGGGITLLGGSDGNKTINWVNSTDAWTFSENINIAAGKKLGVGGSNYGTSGHVLTSGGSGAAPTWSALPAAGSTVSLVANGAISAHDSVIVRTDGDVEKIAGNDNNINTASFETGDVMERGMVSYDSARDKYVSFYKYGADNKLYARIGTLTGSGANTAGSITWTSRILVKDTTIDNVFSAFSSYAGKFLLAYTTGTGGGGGLNCLPVKINTNADGFDVGDEGSVTGSTVYPGEFRLSDTFDDNHCAIVAYRLSSNMYGKAIRLEPNNTSPTLSAQSNIMPSQPYKPKAVILEAHSQRFVSIQNTGSGTYQKGSCVSLSTSSSSPHNMTVHASATQFQSAHELGTCHAAYDSVSDKIFVAWQASTGAGGYSIILSTNGTSGFTLGTILEWSTGNDKPLGDSSNRLNLFCAFDPDDGRCHVIYTNNESKPAFAKFKIATDGSSYERVVAPTAFFTDGTTAHGQAVVHDPTNDRLIITYTKTSNSNYGWYTVYQPQVTNLTAENFIGFSSAAYSNDATAVINVTGNTTTQSSLTPGQKYYVSATGGLQLTPGTPSVEAGVALSSTSLLIKG